MVKRIDKLSPAQTAAMAGWADKWISTGLQTGPADRAKFEANAQKCYEYAGLPWHGRVVWVSSPMVMAIAGPTAAFVIEARKRGIDLRSPDGAVGGAVDDAVRDAVGGAVDGAVRDAVRGAVGGAVRGAVDGAVRDAVDGAVGGAVDGAVGGAVDGAVGDARRNGSPAIYNAVIETIQRSWMNYIGGQFWVGGYYWWSPSFTSFFRDVGKLELDGDLWDRGRAYEATAEAACWWWPHRDFIIVCERPTVINRELRDPSRTRGWGSHQLHAERGPAVAWPDGWGLYYDHGVRMPADIYENPGALTVARIDAEENAEVRRVMISLFGAARYAREGNFKVVQKCAADHPLKGLQNAILLRRDLPDDEPMIMLDMQDSSPDPKTGEFKRYMLRIDPNAYGGRAARECHAAMASTWRTKSDPTQFAFARPEDYSPQVET